MSITLYKRKCDWVDGMLVICCHIERLLYIIQCHLRHSTYPLLFSVCPCFLKHFLPYNHETRDINDVQKCVVSSLFLLQPHTYMLQLPFCALLCYKRKHARTMHNIEIVCLELVYVSGGNEGLLVVQMGESQLVKIVHGHGET